MKEHLNSPAVPLKQVLKLILFSVPDKFAPTLPTRDWLTHPLADNPWYTPILALVPALLGNLGILLY